VIDAESEEERKPISNGNSMAICTRKGKSSTVEQDVRNREEKDGETSAKREGSTALDLCTAEHSIRHHRG
jgi:hypothetical protein